MRRNADVRTVLLRGTLLCWLFAACIAAPANDGTYYTSGNQLLPLVETDIHVWREVLTLSWGEDRTADVDVYYAFYNPGEEKTVLMGFEADSPMYMDSLDLSGAHPYISGFTVKMNGKALPVAASIVRADTLFVNHGKVQGLDLSRYEIDEARSGGYLWNPRANDGVSIAFVYHFNATFKPGFNIVRHHYRYRMSESVYYHYELDYKLSPALRWANGKIGDFTLRIKTRDVPLHFMLKDSVDGRGGVFPAQCHPRIQGNRFPSRFGAENLFRRRHRNKRHQYADRLLCVSLQSVSGRGIERQVVPHRAQPAFRMARVCVQDRGVGLVLQNPVVVYSRSGLSGDSRKPYAGRAGMAGMV